MRREWEPEELIASWTLVDDDWRLVANKAGATRLGFALLLKFFELDARFPRHTGEIPKAAVDYMGQQVEVFADELVQYDLASRQAKRHRVQIREALGFRESSVEDEEKRV